MGERLGGLGDASMLIPVEGVAGKGGGVSSIAVTDGEVQGHHGVAAADICESMCERLGRLGDASMLIPVVAVAGKGGGVAGVAVADGEVQGHHGVAAADIREGMRERLGGLGDIRVLVPVEAVAGESGGVAGVAVSDGEVQRHHGVAAAGIREGMGERLGGLCDIRVLVPVEGVAGEGGGVAGIAVTDGEMQGHHGVATQHVGEGVGERLGGFRDVRVLVPIEAVACEGGGVAGTRGQNGQMQRYGAVASVYICEMLNIIA